MVNDRRGDRRQPVRGGGGFGDRRGRPPRDFGPREGGPREGPAREGPPRNFGPREGGPREGPPRNFGPREGGGQGYGRPPGRPPGGPYPPRSTDEGGMAIRVDPRRLSLLKELAAAEGLRPGQLVQRWVEERLDAERAGETPSPAAGGRLAELESAVAALTAQVAEIASRVTQAAPRAAEPAAAQSTPPSPEPAEAAAPTEAAQEAPAPRRRGRPRKAPTAAAATSRAPAETGGRVALHDEIIAVIEERGPSTAAEIAGAISDRGRYRAPRSDRPLDAATVNSRVSNPVYRSRFVRSGHRIGLAQEG